MSLLTRKRVLLAKIESVYGTDPTPTGGSNAILVRNMNFSPLAAETVGRDLIRPYFGNSDQLLAESHVALDFEVELAGAGALGSAPAWGPLLKACGFGQTLNTASISSITRSSSTATATTASPHGITTGQTFTTTISGAGQSEYNGAVSATATGASTFTYTVSGTPATPATGTLLYTTTAVYAPISASLPSLTFYFNVDGVLHMMTGARGSVEFTVAAKQIPVMKFTFMGIYNSPSDTSAATPTYTSFQQPLVANTDNTASFSLLSYSGYLEQMSLNVANDVQYRTLIGTESVEIIDRKPSGQFVIEAPTIAAKDYFTAALAGTTGTMSVTHGTQAGNRVTLACARVQLQGPQYQESQGIQMLQLPFVATPSTGNDEISITVN